MLNAPRKHDGEAVTGSARDRAVELVARMTLAEKIGHMSQVNTGHHELAEELRQGRIGSILNEVNGYLGMIFESVTGH